MNTRLLPLRFQENLSAELADFDPPHLHLAPSYRVTRVKFSGDLWRQRTTMCPQKSEPLNILQQQPQICSNLNKILRTQDDICYKHYYVVSYKFALTLLKYEFLNNITHKSWVSIAVDVNQNSQNVQPCSVANSLGWWSRVSQLTIAQPSHGHGGLGTVLL